MVWILDLGLGLPLPYTFIIPFILFMSSIFFNKVINLVLILMEVLMANLSTAESPDAEGYKKNYLSVVFRIMDD